MRYVIPLIVIIYLTACKKQYKEQNEQLNGLLMELHQIDSNYSQIDTSTVFEAANQIKTHLTYLHQLVDTLDVEKAQFVAEAYQERNKLFYFQDNYLLFLEELKTSQNQLKALQQDLNNGLLTEEKFKDYFEKEKTIISNLKEKIDSSVQDMNRAFDELIQNTSSVQTLLKELEEKEE